MTSAKSHELLHLMQLASPALPVGAFSYSQGMEAAVEAGVVHDRQSAQTWIEELLCHSLSFMEAPILLRCIDGWRTGNFTAVQYWNDLFLASRETAELRAETVQMGYSLARLLNQFSGIEAKSLTDLMLLGDISFPTTFACAAACWEIKPLAALLAYLWSWTENQVLAALKLVPLGQTDGQMMLFEISGRLPAIATHAATLLDDNIGTFMPRLAILSSQHETQYSRLFRS